MRCDNYFVETQGHRGSAVLRQVTPRIAGDTIALHWTYTCSMSVSLMHKEGRAKGCVYGWRSPEGGDYGSVVGCDYAVAQE